jgi:hypothetical protein
MFAVVAAICFLLALFDVAVGEIEMVELGLFFVALHLAVPLNVMGWRRD